MTKLRKRKLVGLLGLLTISAIVGAFLAAPSILSTYIARKYPDVKVGTLQIDWGHGEVLLENVKIDRDTVKGRLDTVRVDLDKKVYVQGGDLQVTLGQGSSTAAGPSVDVTATGLHLQVTRGELQADLTDARVDQTRVYFESAVVTHPKGTATIYEGSIWRDKSRFEAQRIEGPLPVPLPYLKGVFQVALTGVSLDIPEKVLHFDTASVGPLSFEGPATISDDGTYVDIQVSRLNVNHPWVSPDEAHFNTIHVRIPHSVRTGTGTIAVRVGSASVYLSPETKSIEGTEECATWLEALPEPLPPALRGAKDHFTGKLSFKVALLPVPKVQIQSTCRYECSASPIKEILSGKFKYETYSSTNKLIERESGPLSPGWVPFQDFAMTTVPKAFTLLEDPAFEKHHGVLPLAIENSLKLDLAQGEFMRGGSTITMQLAKNLWLRRYKTIGRKVQETLLTYALESCLSKQQILEMYLNVIEFGPDIYGIGPASNHYFDKAPGSLEPEEAFYLASILPAPKKALPPDHGGLDKARRIMKMLAHSGYISEFLLDEDPVQPTDAWQASD